jgi:hypothetical protein
VIDSGLFHAFDDEDCRRYVKGLAMVLKPTGRLFLLCFSGQDPGMEGCRRRNCTPHSGKDGPSNLSRFEVRPNQKDISYSVARPRAWFVVVWRHL